MLLDQRVKLGKEFHLFALRFVLSQRVECTVRQDEAMKLVVFAT